MSVQYHCQHPLRLQLVRDNAAGPGGLPLFNGIEYLEVDATDQRLLSVHFVHPLPGQAGGVPDGAPALSAANVLVEGGVRVRNVEVVSVTATDRVLQVEVDRPGDYSTYRLCLVTSATQPEPPPGFDPLLSAVDFSFKVHCPSDFDCRVEETCVEPAPQAPEIDYLAKDYASFRRLMLDRLAETVPQWTERNPADLGVVLVEVLAYAADHLSYYQDAVGTEAYLGTANKRVSVRRHARLLDYRAHEGCNARTFVHCDVDPDVADTVALPHQLTVFGQLVTTRFFSRCQRGVVIDEAERVRAQSESRPIVFEPLHDVVLVAAHNQIDFYTWGDERCCLPRGATRATLRDDAASRLRLRRGDVLVFEERRSPVTGTAADADPVHRHAVRLTKVEPEADQPAGPLDDPVVDPTPLVDPLTGQAIVEIDWHVDDALPFALCLSSVVDGELVETAVAMGNIVLADHGDTLTDQLVEPPEVPAQGNYRPILGRQGLTHATPYDHGAARAASASASLQQDPRRAVPALRLLESGGAAWLPQPDLLNSDRFERAFVAELEEDGLAQLRFGDGLMGRRPAAGSNFLATYRVGQGVAGNIGAESLTHLVVQTDHVPGALAVRRVRNPLPAKSGDQPEPTDDVRRYAPQAFRIQERAVTEKDYEAVAERHAEVLKAAATLRWTGSWHTMFLTVDRAGGRPVDAAFETELRGFLERFRLAGHDLEIDPPRHVPLEIVMTVCVHREYVSDKVEAALLATFSSVDLPDGRRGFFHPDNFTFGQPVYLSRVVAAAMAVPGVLWVDVDDGPGQPNLFRRRGEAGSGIASGRLAMGRLEIAQLDNDPNAPERGRIAFIMEGGL